MPPKFSDRVLESEPRFGARVVQPARSNFYSVFFRGHPAGQFKTQEAASNHMWKLIKEVLRARRRGR